SRRPCPYVPGDRSPIPRRHKIPGTNSRRKDRLERRPIAIWRAALREQTGWGYNMGMIICLFDIDGTLLASGGAGKAALESSFTGEFGIELRGHIPYAGRTDRAIMRDMFAMHDMTDTPENLHKLMG